MLLSILNKLETLLLKLKLSDLWTTKHNIMCKKQGWENSITNTNLVKHLNLKCKTYWNKIGINSSQRFLVPILFWNLCWKCWTIPLNIARITTRTVYFVHNIVLEHRGNHRLERRDGMFNLNHNDFTDRVLLRSRLVYNNSSKFRKQ